MDHALEYSKALSIFIRQTYSPKLDRISGIPPIFCFQETIRSHYMIYSFLLISLTNKIMFLKSLYSHFLIFQLLYHFHFVLSHKQLLRVLKFILLFFSTLKFNFIKHYQYNLNHLKTHITDLIVIIIFQFVYFYIFHTDILILLVHLATHSFCL